MIAPTCKHSNFKGVGSVRGVKRFKCLDCGVTFSAPKPKRPVDLIPIGIRDESAAGR